MIFPINKKHTFFSKEKTLLTFFFILFISFSAFGQQDKKLILLQTSDVHSRLEPINQEGDPGIMIKADSYVVPHL